MGLHPDAEAMHSKNTHSKTGQERTRMRAMLDDEARCGNIGDTLTAASIPATTRHEQTRIERPPLRGTSRPVLVVSAQTPHVPDLAPEIVGGERPAGRLQLGEEAQMRPGQIRPAAVAYSLGDHGSILSSAR